MVHWWILYWKYFTFFVPCHPCKTNLDIFILKWWYANYLTYCNVCALVVVISISRNLWINYTKQAFRVNQLWTMTCSYISALQCCAVVRSLPQHKLSQESETALRLNGCCCGCCAEQEWTWHWPFVWPWCLSALVPCTLQFFLLKYAWQRLEQ